MIIHEKKGVQPIASSLSFKCDQCGFEEASDKGLKQHNRMKNRISQVDGNNSESNDYKSLSEENSDIYKDCFKRFDSYKTDAIDEDFFKASSTIVECPSCAKYSKQLKNVTSTYS